ncbi:LAGLIDADG family homing endonuclease [Streptomyces longwoodensis]|uniref:LAGLIDADG family homing endonuclease n=1 Tax=Streptomyces longwoodensis TaxID=68231 RepID=UPI0033D0E2C4
MRTFAEEHGCRVREIPQGNIVRLRFPFRAGRRNPLIDILRRFGVWGQRCDEKRLPDIEWSREFWIGCLSGLIDTDGCVRRRVNTRGTVHGTAEFATVSPRLAEQVSDTLLRLGVANTVRARRASQTKSRSVSGHPIVSRRAVYSVEISRATALVRFAQFVDLRIGYKAAALLQVAREVEHVTPAQSEMHGYDTSVALDRVTYISPPMVREVYGVTLTPSGLFLVNGLVVGAS